MIAWFLLSLLADTTGPEAAWKLEAMNAAERAQSQATHKQAVCDRILATAYVLHLTKPELVRKVTDKAEFYHLVMGGSAGKDAPGVVFDLAYVYDRKKSELIGARVTRLPEKWVLAFAEANKILVSDPSGCVYALDTTNPFVAKASVRP